tara:strand:- start:1603 stop:1860 length:258 start_codon:yes stop_codon:yes gene_type:complete
VRVAVTSRVHNRRAASLSLSIDLRSSSSNVVFVVAATTTTTTPDPFVDVSPFSAHVTTENTNLLLSRKRRRTRDSSLIAAESNDR